MEKALIKIIDLLSKRKFSELMALICVGAVLYVFIFGGNILLSYFGELIEVTIEQKELIRNTNSYYKVIEKNNEIHRLKVIDFHQKELDLIKENNYILKSLNNEKKSN